MKILIVLLLPILLLGTSAFGRGGVGVGNADACYTAPAGFSVRYAKSLKLDVISPTVFEISNANFIKAIEQQSKVSFTVTRGEAHTLEELAAELARRHPDLYFRPIQQPGASGYYWEQRSVTELKGLYYLLTSNGDLIKVEVKARPEGNGIALIEPIVRSITYDIRPPVVSEMYFASTVWKAGSRQKIFLRITDDYSGIGLERPSFIWFDDPTGLQTDILFEIENDKFQHESGDLYSYEFTVNPYAKAQTVRLGSIAIEDQAGNGVQLYVSRSGDRYRQGAGQEPSGPSLPLIYATIESNKPVDVTAPEFLGLRVDETTWKTGSTYRVYMKFKEEQSGIRTRYFHTDGFKSTFTKEGRHFTFFSIPHLNFVGDDWYYLEVKVPEYLPSGEYVLPEIFAADKVGNTSFIGIVKNDPEYYHSVTRSDPEIQTPVRILKIQIRNEKTEDIRAPKVHTWRIDPVITAGGKGRFYFQASDDVSGLDDKALGYLFLYGDKLTNSEAKPIGVYPKELRSEGSNWYSFEFDISPYAKPGDYYVGVFSIEDAARNEMNIGCVRDIECKIWDREPANLPRLTFKIVR